MKTILLSGLLISSQFLSFHYSWATERLEHSEAQWKADAGGQIRVRGDFALSQNLTDFTFAPGEKEAQFLERVRLHGCIGIPGLGVKAFVQVQWYGRWGGVDRCSQINLYQGYIEWSRILGSCFSLKVGRQDFAYGSAFFLGADDFYDGLSWDGFKISLNASDVFSSELIGAKMAKLDPGDPHIYLTGIYSSCRIYKEGSLEGYLFYSKGGFPILHREFKAIESVENWYTLGTRLAGKVGRIDYELEPQLQWRRERNTMGGGKYNVRAYGGHMDFGYTLRVPWETCVFAGYAFGSGKNDPPDGKTMEFHGDIFNDHHLVGDINIINDLSGITINEIHASGIQLCVVGISLNPLPGLDLNLDVHRFWAARGFQNFSKDLGVEINLRASCKIKKGGSLIIGFNRFFTGRFFEQASGSKEDINYTYVQAQVDF